MEPPRDGNAAGGIMSSPTNIEWATTVWNPVVGCTRASRGCDSCYAVRMTHRLEAMGRSEYKGLTVLNPKGDRHFNGTVRCLPERLHDPIGWRKPRRVFVNSMSDLFHKDVPFEFIDWVFGVMALCPRHTFLVLTKRPQRMAEYLARTDEDDAGRPVTTERLVNIAAMKLEHRRGREASLFGWPLPNVWLGTSVEDQQHALERIPAMLACPNAMPWISAEPLLGPINLSVIPNGSPPSPNCPSGMPTRGLRWVVVGGESGPGARHCDVAWIRAMARECKRRPAIPVFVKQLGAHVQCANDQVSEWLEECNLSLEHVGEGAPRFQGDPIRVHLLDKKGGNMAEWPADLRIREMPKQETWP